MSLFGSNRRDTREVFFQTWKKVNSGQPLDGIEAVVAQVVKAHPEYHAVLSNPELTEDADYLPEHGGPNPFLHMGLHLAVREQVATDRPPGIAALFNTILVKTGNSHDTEHKVLDCLAETLWEAQSGNVMPDEQAYLERLRRL